MGRATVVGGGDNGLYSVKVDFGKARVDALIAKLEATETEDIASAEQKEIALAQAQSLLDGAVGEIDAAIQAYKVALESEDEAQIKDAFDQITALLSAAEELRGNVQIARLESDKAKAKLIETRKRLSAVRAIEAEKTLPAWCADYTEDAAGEVATIEIPGEPANIVIAPKGRAPTSADGFLLAREIMSPEQAFFNAAILPGWQKFKPTYRVGIISNINKAANTCSITLVSAESSAQSLNINAQASFSDVPVEYMFCNAKAFQDGDRVVVRFTSQDIANPVVIGFESNPRECVIDLSIYLQGQNKKFFIADGAWQAEAVTPHAAYEGRMTDWRDEDRGLSVQWAIRSSRYANVTANIDQLETPTSTSIYQNGQALWTAPNQVTGAAIDLQGRVICVTYGSDFYVAEVWRRNLENTDWDLLGSFDLFQIESNGRTNCWRTSWLFNPSATKAVCVSFFGHLHEITIEGDTATVSRIQPDFPNVENVSDGARINKFFMAADYLQDGNMTTLAFNYENLQHSQGDWRNQSVEWLLDDEIIQAGETAYARSTVGGVTTFSSAATNVCLFLGGDLRFRRIFAARYSGTASSGATGTFAVEVAQIKPTVEPLAGPHEYTGHDAESLYMSGRGTLYGLRRASVQRHEELRDGYITVINHDPRRHNGSDSYIGPNRQGGTVTIVTANVDPILITNINNNVSIPPIDIENNLQAWRSSPSHADIPSDVIYNINVIG